MTNTTIDSSSTVDSVFRRFDSAINKFENSITCPICRDIVNNPFTNSICGHTYCVKCISSLLDEKPTVQCPVCANPISSSSLIPNPIISSMSSSFSNLHEVSVCVRSTMLSLIASCERFAHANITLRRYCKSHIQDTYRAQTMVSPSLSLEDNRIACEFSPIIKDYIEKEEEEEIEMEKYRKENKLKVKEEKNEREEKEEEEKEEETKEVEKKEEKERVDQSIIYKVKEEDSIKSSSLLNDHYYPDDIDDKTKPVTYEEQEKENGGKENGEKEKKKEDVVSVIDGIDIIDTPSLSHNPSVPQTGSLGSSLEETIIFDIDDDMETVPPPKTSISEKGKRRSVVWEVDSRLPLASSGSNKHRSIHHHSPPLLSSQHSQNRTSLTTIPSVSSHLSRKKKKKNSSSPSSSSSSSSPSLSFPHSPSYSHKNTNVSHHIRSNPQLSQPSQNITFSKINHSISKLISLVPLPLSLPSYASGRKQMMKKCRELGVSSQVWQSSATSLSSLSVSLLSSILSAVKREYTFLCREWNGKKQRILFDLALSIPKEKKRKKGKSSSSAPLPPSASTSSSSSSLS
ncbi:hypothetical protein ADUPG1_008898 [Aduncisulcus paluster]|uniref:RING-type domain-containing protein n=1 Tax=Aduncisulcus paluster TaxID=2918883 RepID=A0ABQ5KWJ6_9EUKA|nr:hypothetical protein ADUPG1_008898 [Aduncisulcus paluster]